MGLRGFRVVNACVTLVRLSGLWRLQVDLSLQIYDRGVSAPDLIYRESMTRMVSAIQRENNGVSSLTASERFISTGSIQAQPSSSTQASGEDA